VPDGIASAGASACDPASSTSMWGRVRSSQACSHQLPRPGQGQHGWLKHAYTYRR
jgi:hypothetical protein